MSTARSQAGARLVYIVGASGAGKDTLIHYARNALGRDAATIFAHRYITRPAGANSENHVALTRREFAQRKRKGLFALDWESHGLRYGVGIELDAWLEKGLTVVVNGSRDYIPAARRRYPGIEVVWIVAGRRTLASRLANRARESQSQIDARLERNSRLAARPARGVVRIRNEGPVADAGERLLAVLAGARL